MNPAKFTLKISPHRWWYQFHLIYYYLGSIDVIFILFWILTWESEALYILRSLLVLCKWYLWAVFIDLELFSLVNLTILYSIIWQFHYWIIFDHLSFIHYLPLSHLCGIEQEFMWSLDILSHSCLVAKIAALAALPGYKRISLLPPFILNFQKCSYDLKAEWTEISMLLWVLYIECYALNKDATTAQLCPQ